MTIDWNHFTPWASLAGGVLLGLASARFILVNGRILGISGIVGGLLRPASGDVGWRLAFLLGLLAAPLLYILVAAPTVPRIDAGWTTVVVAGLLVGVGTRYGSGCTSGHGVCGLSRLSPRSLAATLAFMSAGFLTVFLFGIGLIVSGMTDPGKVIGFLDLFGAWDASLALVMGGAILVGVFAFALAKRRTTTFLGGALTLPGSRDIDRRLVVGGLLFGAGWGLAGFCPGPAIVSLASGQPKAAVFVVAMLAGMLVFEFAERRRPLTAA